jgi:hypothetical protein
MLQEKTVTQQRPNSLKWLMLIGGILMFLCLCVGGAGKAFIAYNDWQIKQYIGQPTPVPDLTYVDLRNMAFNIKASDLSIEFEENSNKPYGVIMDWNIGSATATLVSFSTGDASLYYSTGGGWLGGYGVEEVSSASIKFVNLASEYVEKLGGVSEYPLPPVNHVRFYFVTPQGVYGSGDIDGDLLIKDDIDFTALFDAAQDVISEIRIENQK